jgi:hypothetical protein
MIIKIMINIRFRKVHLGIENRCKYKKMIIKVTLIHKTHQKISTKSLVLMKALTKEGVMMLKSQLSLRS